MALEARNWHGTSLAKYFSVATCNVVREMRWHRLSLLGSLALVVTAATRLEGTSGREHGFAQLKVLATLMAAICWFGIQSAIWRGEKPRFDH